MGLIGLIRQRRHNKEIEAKANGLEKKSIDLINHYAEFIFDAKAKQTFRGSYFGVNLPPSTPRPKLRGCNNYSVREEDYAEDYLLMKNFLESHKDYKTRAAKKIRIWYNI